MFATHPSNAVYTSLYLSELSAKQLHISAHDYLHDYLNKAEIGGPRSPTEGQVTKWPSVAQHYSEDVSNVLSYLGLPGDWSVEVMGYAAGSVHDVGTFTSPCSAFINLYVHLLVCSQQTLISRYIY